jgi:site-specific DNA-methyltransferase (adenine-specific)
MCRKQTVGWEPTCTCAAGAPVPCTVLDPFSGSGTTTLVARELRRNSIGIELNPASIQEAKERLGIAAQAVLDTGSVEYEILVVE